MAARLKGRKLGGGAQQQSPIQTPDSLFSTDCVEVILGLGEGPIKGLVNGAQSYYLGDTPLVNQTGYPNVGMFDLRILKGTNPADEIKPNLGGTGSATQVGQSLIDQNVWVVRSGTHANIDFLDIRMTISQLRMVDSKGNDLPAELDFIVEVKPHSSSNWSAGFSDTYDGGTVDTSGSTAIQGTSTQPGSVVNPAYRETYVQPSQPTPLADGAVWFNSSLNNYPPLLSQSGNWVTPSNLNSSQPSGELFRWIWTDPNGVTRHAFWTADAITPPAGFTQYDYLVTPAGVLGSDAPQAYTWNGSSWVNYMQWAQPPEQLLGGVGIYGHATTTEVKQLRIPVARIDEPYDIRISRASPVNSTSYFADLSWESFQEINRDSLNFPDLAVAHLTVQASSTFTTLPEFKADIYGRVVNIPSNYDPVAKTYNGTWDGTFVVEWTDNPAWCSYDLVMNTRFGMNAYAPVVFDKWDIYAFAQHCDLHGITYNDYIQDPRSLAETINYICGIAGGVFVDRMDGYCTVLFNTDDQPAVALFSAENITDGTFTYSFTDVTERKNDFSVSFVNPDLNWREDRIRVFDQNDIDVHGRNPEEFVAIGCINQDEAVRRGRLRLATALTEKRIVTFKTNRQGQYVSPYEIILVADSDMENGVSGRVKSVISPTQLELRDPIYIEAGFTYTISFTVPSDAGGFEVQDYTLTGASGNLTTFTLTSALRTTLPEFAQFTLSQADKIGLPKPYLITSIEESDGEPDSLTITATEVNRQKWAYCDGYIELRDILPLQTGQLSGYVYPVSGIKITPENTLDGHHNLVLSWNASDTPQIKFYRIYQTINAGPRTMIGEPVGTTFTVQDVIPATYNFTVVAVGLNGQESPPVTFEQAVAGDIRVVVPPTNLRLQDEPVVGIFNTLSPVFAWDASIGPFIVGYHVEILDTASGTVVRSEDTSELKYQYTIDMNTADGGPRRSITIRVSSKDKDGYLSAPISYSAANPPPAALSIEATNGPDMIFVKFENPSDADYKGTLIWISTINGFNPALTTPTYDGLNNNLTFPEDSGTYYVRAAAYDGFGKNLLNYSSQIEVDVFTNIVDIDPPAVPTGVTLATTGTVLDDGTFLTTLTADWGDSPSDNFSTFEYEIKEGTGNYVGGVTSTPHLKWTGLLPAETVTFHVRSKSKTGFPSAFSAEVSKTIAANTTPPNPVTGLTGTSGFQNIFLSWTNPTNKDLDHVDIYENTVNDSSTATKIASVAGSAFTRGGLASGDIRWYWAKSVNSSGTASTAFSSPTQVQTAHVQTVDIAATAITRAQLANNIIDQTAVASNLSLVGNVASLPSPVGYTGPSTVFNAADGKLYRYVGGQFVANVNASDIAGTISNNQIANLSVAKLLTGQLPSGVTLISSAIVGQLVADQFAANSITASKLALVANGAALNADPNCTDINAWAQTVGTSGFFRTTDGAVGPNVMDATAQTWFEEKRRIPIDRNKTYRLRVTVRAAADATGTFYGSVTLRDVGGAEIAGAGARWAYWPSGIRPSTSWQTYTLKFGANTNNPFPANAVTMSPGTILNYGGTASYMQAQDIRIEEAVDASLIVDGAIQANHMGVDSVEAGTIAAAAVNTRELVAGAVTAEKMAIGSGTNLIYNGDFLSGAANASWATSFTPTGTNLSGIVPDQYTFDANGIAYHLPGMKSYMIHIGGVGPVNQISDYYCQYPTTKTDGTSGWSKNFPVTPGKYYEASAYLSLHGCSGQMLVQWFDINGAFISSVFSAALPSNGNGMYDPSTTPRAGMVAQAPAGAVTAAVSIRTYYDGVYNGPYTFICGIMFAAANDGQFTSQTLSPFSPGSYTVIDGSGIRARSLTADRLTAYSITANELSTGTLITTSAQIGTAVIDSANIASLSADKITAGSILTGSVILGGAYGTYTANDIADRATRPLDYINAQGYPGNRGSTTLNPGVVLISGATTLANWRQAGDDTKIAGGSISANTISTNKLTVGNRGIGTVALDFTYDKSIAGGTINWSQGYILYTDDNGISAAPLVVAGSVTGVTGANMYVYWDKTNPNVLTPTTAWNDVLANPNCILMASYNGATGLVATRGAGVIIDGDRIVARTITATNLIQTENVITATAQIANAIITSAHIHDLSADKITTGVLNGALIRVAGGARTGAIYIDGTNSQLYGNDPANTRQMWILSQDGVSIWDAAGNVVLSSGQKMLTTGIAGLTNTANMVPNSDLTGGVANMADVIAPGVTIDFNGLSSVSPGPGWFPPGMDARSIHASSFAPTQVSDVLIYNVNSAGYVDKFPVIGGAEYEFSAYISAHRCSGYFYLTVCDNAGTVLAYPFASGVVQVQSSGALVNWARSVGKYIMPSNAAYVALRMRQQDGINADAWMMFTGVYFGRTVAGQTGYSDWSKGPTQFQITAANASTYLASAAIGSAQIGNAVIQTAHIGNLQVDNLQLANSSTSNIAFAAGAGGTTNYTCSVSITVRSNSRVVILAAHRGNMSTYSGSLAGIGEVQIYRGATLIDHITNNMSFGGASNYIPTMSFQLFDSPGAGIHTYRITNTNPAMTSGGNYGQATLIVMEVDK